VSRSMAQSLADLRRAVQKAVREQQKRSLELGRTVLAQLGDQVRALADEADALTETLDVRDFVRDVLGPPLEGVDTAVHDRVWGMLLGAACGDAVGAYCELSDTPVDAATVDEALSMRGGGTHELSGGQVTDDTELALSLAWALCDMLDTGRFDLDVIARRYHAWIESEPFDCGRTCHATMSRGQGQWRGMWAESVRLDEKAKATFEGSVGNVANGSLMRCHPLIVFGLYLPQDELARLVVLDSALTHSNHHVLASVAAYAVACQHLITHAASEHRHVDAFRHAATWLQRAGRCDDVAQPGCDVPPPNGTPVHARRPPWPVCPHAARDVRGWVLAMSSPSARPRCATSEKGFAKTAVQQSFYLLWRARALWDAVGQSVAQGGDTDTNACIVGGLLGAYHGVRHIPMHALAALHDCTHPAHERRVWQARQWWARDADGGPHIVDVLLDASRTALRWPEWDP